MSDCGPVAALNILKWAGFPVTYKDHIKHLKVECKYENSDEFAGVRWWGIRDALSRICNGVISVRTYHVRRIEVLERHVCRGGAFILRYRTAPRVSENPSGHFHYSAVIPHDDSKSFLWLNHIREYPQIIATPSEFEASIMKKAQFGDVPVALMIRKNIP